RALPIELGKPHRSRLQFRSDEVGDVDDTHGRYPDQGARRDLDQPRQAAARVTQARASVLRITHSLQGGLARALSAHIPALCLRPRLSPNPPYLVLHLAALLSNLAFCDPDAI